MCRLKITNDVAQVVVDGGEHGVADPNVGYSLQGMCPALGTTCTDR